MSNMENEIVDLSQLTEDQKKAVYQDGQVIVSAAAGSGKTSTMMKKITYMIANGASLDDMLVLVYNNAASEELILKAHKALFDASCKATGELKEKFRQEIDNLPFARISTIHSFCNSMLRENFEKLGLSPTFEILDESAAEQYFNKALDKVFQEYAENNDPEFEELLVEFSKRRNENDLKEEIKSLFLKYDIQPNGDEFIKNVEECYGDFETSKFLDILVGDADDILGEVKNILLSQIEVFTENKEESYLIRANEILEFVERVLGAKTNIERMSIISKGLALSPVRIKSKEPYVKMVVEDFKGLTKYVQDYINDIVEIDFNSPNTKLGFEQNGRKVKKMIEIMLKFKEEFEELKSKKDMLTYSDLEHKMVDLINISGDSLKKYKYVFVDEYQDVNPTQEYIINSLVTENCFFVGDVKQSIYGFRMADPTNFLRRYKRYKEGNGTAIDFTKNFRSDDSILNFNNYIFDQVMTEKSADVDYKGEARFNTETNDIDKDRVQLHFFLTEKKEKETAYGLYDIRDLSEEQKKDARYMEGYFIADKIHQLVGHAKKKTPEEGNIEYSDISILLRSRGPQTKKLIDALLDKGIPLNEGKFSNNQEGIEEPLLNYLRVLDNPYQDYALAGFLLSVFGGLTEEELAIIAKRKAESLYDKVLLEMETDSDISKKLDVIFKKVEENRIKSSTKNVYDLVAGIVADYSFDAYLKQRGLNQYNYLQAFLSNISKQKYESLSEFLREYKFDSKSINQSGGENCVKISTMHAFKGLESEVVFVPYMDRQYSTDTTRHSIFIDGNGFIGLPYFDNEKKEVFQTISQLALKKIIKARECKEEMRLLYVALTRAKSYMYLSATASEAKAGEFASSRLYGTANSYLKLIEQAIFQSHQEYPWYVHTEENYPILTTPVTYPSIDEMKGDKKLIKAIDKALKYDYPYKESTGLARKYSVSEIDSRMNDETAQTMFSDAANLGTGYHAVMEHIDFGDVDIDTIKAKIDEMVKTNIITEDIGTKIDPSVIKKCLDSPLMQYASKNQCLREQRFVEYISAKDILQDTKTEDKVLVQGIIDLVILGEKNIIVDYKNVKAFNEFNLKQYGKQLEIYTQALEKALNIKVNESCLYAFQTGEVISLRDIKKLIK